MEVAISNLDQVINKLPLDLQENARQLIDTVKLLESKMAELDPEAHRDHQALYNLRDQLIGESDRGLCLFAIGRLEVILHDLLDKKLIGSKTFKKDLFNNNGALSTLSAKIKLSYSIGLISKGYYNEIDQLRQIRNRFAHSDQPLNFDSDEIAILCSKLQVFASQTDRPNRTKFISTFLYIASSLMAELRQTKTFSEKEELLSPEALATINKRRHQMRSIIDPLSESK